MPLPNPTSKVPKKDRNIGLKISFKKESNGIVQPIVAAITKIFIIVPTPGLSFNGSQNIRTKQLIKKVDNPTPMLTLFATPAARTVQGVTPFEETTKILYPRPKKNRPKQSKKKVSNLGKNIFGFGALHDVTGTDLVKKIFEKNLRSKLKIFM